MTLKVSRKLKNYVRALFIFILYVDNINLTNNIKSLPSPNQSFMWILSDNNRRYISDVKLCYGKQYGMSKNESSNKRVVKQLVQPFRHRKRKFAYHLESGLFWAHFASSKATRFDRQRWAHSMFFALVDFAVINTLTCCKLNGTLPHSIQTWSEYLKLLACELVYPWVLERVPVGSSKYRRYPDVAGGAEDIVEFLNKFRSKRNQVRLRKCLNEKQDESSSDTAAPSTSQPEKSNVSNIFSDASSSSSDFSESEMDDDGDKFLKQDLEENESEKKDASITTERLTRSNSVNVAYHSSHNNLHHWFRKRPEDVKTDALMINEGMKRPAPKWQPKHEPEWEPKAPDWTQCSISLPVQAKSEIVQIDLSDEGNGSISGETNESPTGPMSSPLLSSLKISRLSCITYPEQANRNQPSDGSNSVTTNIVSSSVGKACFFCSQDDMTAPSKRTKYSTCCTNCYKYVCSNHVQIIYKCIDCCEN